MTYWEKKNIEVKQTEVKRLKSSERKLKEGINNNNNNNNDNNNNAEKRHAREIDREIERGREEENKKKEIQIEIN